MDVKCLFSPGHLLLSHIHLQLDAQSTWAILCLGHWSCLGFIKTKDMQQVVSLPDVQGQENVLESSWDAIGSTD